MATSLAVQDRPATSHAGTIGNALQVSHETSASAVAAQAKAMVEARYLMALHRPRSWSQVRVKLLEACERPGFAEIAMYGVPRWDAVKRREILITGPSIRFAEEAARCMGNLLVDPMITYDDQEKRILKVMVTDLESNLSWPADVVVAKTVERRQLKKGQTPLRARTNGEGETVYVVAATDDELAMKQNSACSKAARNGILRLLPGDILEEAIERVQTTVRDQDKADPKAAVNRVCDLFYRLGVEPAQIEAYLGHPLATIAPSELADLRAIYTAMKDGQGTWADVMAARGSGATAAPSAPATAPARGTAGLRERMAQAPAAPAPAPPPEPEATPVAAEPAPAADVFPVKDLRGKDPTTCTDDELRTALAKARGRSEVWEQRLTDLLEDRRLAREAAAAPAPVAPPDLLHATPASVADAVGAAQAAKPKDDDDDLPF